MAGSRRQKGKVQGEEQEQIRKLGEERALEVKADCEHMQIILDVGHFPQLMIYWLESLKEY